MQRVTDNPKTAQLLYSGTWFAPRHLQTPAPLTEESQRGGSGSALKGWQYTLMVKCAHARQRSSVRFSTGLLWMKGMAAYSSSGIQAAASISSGCGTSVL